MGQKVNPNGMRITVSKNWRSRWYADKADFGRMLHEDNQIRGLLQKRLRDSSVAEVEIERSDNRARVTIHTARPGIVIGRKGADIERLRESLGKLTDKEIYLEIKEIKVPDLNAQLVAESVAMQMERRVSFRRAMKRALQMTMELGALGIRLEVSGRLGGAELSRRESYLQGMVPLHTLRANVKYGFCESRTPAGILGVKCWICLKDEEEAGHAANAQAR